MQQRKLDTLAKLREPAADVWVATASAADGARAHLVPLSLAWIDERVVLAVESDSLTARNIVEHGIARLALGGTRDVVMIDAVLDRSFGVSDAPAAISEAYAEQSDWDPRTAGDGYLYLLLAPERVQAWREVNELSGRTLMRAGIWLV